jgi:crotonobetainyl-CoA:carnitine CoA-transferase CaiB-like acyl-CoA transferase
MVVEMEHPHAGTLRLLGTPVRLSDTPASLRLVPPDLGQDTEDVMRELGCTDDEIAALREQGAFD